MNSKGLPKAEKGLLEDHILNDHELLQKKFLIFYTLKNQVDTRNIDNLKI